MAFVNMYGELRGFVPKCPVDLCKTLVNRAWRDACRQSLWSFNVFESNITSPNLVQAGTVTVTQGSSAIVFNGAATTAINAIQFGPPSTIQQRQFRIGIGTIYSIYTWDGAGNMTLDRPYAEASGSAQSYTISQCYFAPPYQDFLDWITIRDIVNFNDLITTKNRDWVDLRDPQRSVFYLPTHAVFYRLDPNPNSLTYQFPLFEWWGNPQYSLVYQVYGLRKGALLVSDSDTIPPQLGEDCVMALARKYGYEWQMANSDSGPKAVDWRYLIGETAADYKRLFREYRRQDRNTVDNWSGVFRRGWTWPSLEGFYNSISGQANPGVPW